MSRTISTILRLPALFVLTCILQLCAAQDCGSQAGNAVCANNLCCSQYGYCGSTTDFCGTGCQSGCPTGSPPASQGVGSILTSALFDSFFPPSQRDPLYTYDAFIGAATTYGSFGTTGSSDQQKQDIAAFCAHVYHETSGLHYVSEIDQSNSYCDTTNTQYPCAAGKSYYGRGPLQITWNYNYGAASSSVGYDILSNPDQVATDATLSFKAALWFWTTPSSPKPSCHDVMVGNWSPSSADVAAGRNAGFGVTIDIINGGIECGHADTSASDRVTQYQNFCSQLNVSPGSNLDCASMQPF